MSYENLIGRQYVDGKVDCFSIIRDFYKQTFDIDIPNYARPKDWWNTDMNLYMDRYHKNGFRPLDVLPSEYQFGDVFLISYMSTVPNHAGILVDNGNMLHHFTNRLSAADPYRGIWRNNTVAVMRHKDVVIPVNQTIGQIVDYLPPTIRRKIDAAIKTNEVSS